MALQAHAKLFLNMKELATQSEQDLEGYPGTIVPLQFRIFGSCPGAVMLSYPKGGGQDKVMKYIDIPLMALAAEAEGLDLRLLYLSRSAADIVASTTQHRNFDTKGNGNRDTEPPAKSFVRYMQILLTQATLLQAMMHEVDPAFVVCQRYDTVQNDEQVARVAEFVSPNPEVAKIFAASFEGAVHTTRRKLGGHENQLVYEGEEVIMMRLQEKFDALDAAFCPPYQNQV